MKLNKQLLLSLAVLPSIASALSIPPGPGYFDFGAAPASYGTYTASHADATYESLGSSDPVWQTVAIPIISAAPIPAYGSGNDVSFLGSFVDQSGTIQSPNFGSNNYWSGYWGMVDITIDVLNHASGRYDANHKLYLDGWIDYGHDGTFGDQSGVIGSGPNTGTSWSEHILSVALDPSTWSTDTFIQQFSFMNGEGPNGPFYARFRLNYDQGTNDPTSPYTYGSIQDFGGLGHAQGVPEPSVNLLILIAGSMAWGFSRFVRQS